MGACGSDEGAAAIVDGTEITHQDVVDELVAIRGNDAYLQAVEGSGATTSSAPPRTPSTTAFAAELLTRHPVPDRRQRGRPARARSRRRVPGGGERRVVRSLAGFSPTGDGEAVLDGFRRVPRLARDLELRRPPPPRRPLGQPCVDDAAVEAYYEANEAEFEQACARHILVATAEEADEIAADLGAGGDFAALAAERSTDTGSGAQGGDLGCAPPAATSTRVPRRVFSQDRRRRRAGGDRVRLPRDPRRQPRAAALDDVRDEIVTAFAEQVQAAFGAWFIDALAAADVTVDGRYGTWDAATAEINRPAPTPATTPSSTTDPATASGPRASG